MKISKKMKDIIKKLTLLLIKNIYITERTITKKKKIRKTQKKNLPLGGGNPHFIGFNGNISCYH